MRFLFAFALVGNLFAQGMTGTWDGARKSLEKEGVTITSAYVTDIGRNVTGGLRKRTIYSGMLEAAVSLDFEKLVSAQGLSLVVSNYLMSGQNLSNSVGSFFTIQEIFTPGNYFFGEFKLAWSNPQETFTFEAGRLFAGDVFATNELWQYYITSGVNANLESIEANIFFPSFNITAWAARVSYQPNENWHLIGAIYDADPKAEDPNKHGLYLPLKTDKGYFAIGQIMFKHQGSFPGTASFGGYYVSSRFEELNDPTKKQSGNYGLYLIFDQMIFSEKGEVFTQVTHAQKAKQPFRKQTIVPKNRPQGLTIWGAGYIAPQDKINIQKYQLAGGFLYQGLFPSRPQDVTAFGVTAGKFSNVLKDQGTETVLELDHRLQMMSWFYLTPDIQYIVHPSGRTSIPNALVLGIEAGINF